MVDGRFFWEHCFGFDLFLGSVVGFRKDFKWGWVVERLVTPWGWLFCNMIRVG
jgi:hypothetical protein